VVTSPYNALLSLSRLARHADCVFPLENQALLDICSAVEAKGRLGQTRAGSAVTGAGACGWSMKSSPHEKLGVMGVWCGMGAGGRVATTQPGGEGHRGGKARKLQHPGKNAFCGSKP
jgi:hypothetical protein